MFDFYTNGPTVVFVYQIKLAKVPNQTKAPNAGQASSEVSIHCLMTLTLTKVCHFLPSKYE